MAARLLLKLLDDDNEAHKLVLVKHKQLPTFPTDKLNVEIHLHECRTAAWRGESLRDFGSQNLDPTWVRANWCRGKGK
jgi:hypothetical protein